MNQIAILKKLFRHKVTKPLRFTKLILLIFLLCATLCLSDFVARGNQFHERASHSALPNQKRYETISNNLQKKKGVFVGTNLLFYYFCITKACIFPNLSIILFFDCFRTTTFLQFILFFMVNFCTSHSVSLLFRFFSHLQILHT